MSDEQVDIFGWLADRTGCGTLRIMQPLDALEETSQGKIKTHYHEVLAKKGLMPKVLVGQRVCKDGPSNLWQSLSKLDQRPKLVFEVDDDLWNVDPSNAKAFAWFNNGLDVPARTYHDVRGNLERNIAVADRVTVTTQALADIVSQWNDDVRIVPNTLPQWLLEYERPQRERLTVGWMGSATHSMDWDTSSSYIRKFLLRNPEVQFHMLGASYGSWLRLPQEQVVETPWISSVAECWKTIDFDIALAPLKPHVFNQSKSNLKALEAAALGIPIVASDCGPYPTFVEHGKTGFLVKRDHEWSKYLYELTNDVDMRIEMGQNARQKAQGWTLEGNIDNWKDALCEW